MSPRPKRRRQYGTGSVYKNAAGRWIGTIEAGTTPSGARRRITVSASTEAEAKRRMERRRSELDRGATAGNRTTVKTWADTWLERTSHTARPKTHTTDRGAVTKWIVPTIGHKRVVDLTPADVYAVTSAVRDATSSTTAHRYHGTLLRLLKAAEAEGYDIPPRVLAVKPPGIAAHDRADIAVPQALALLQVASTLPHGSRWVAPLLQGMRPAECLGLTWDKVDDETLTVSWQLQALPYKDKHDRSKGFRIPDGYEAKQLDRSIHLVRPKSKAGKRVIPLVPFMANALATWREIAPQSPHGLVWPALDGTPPSDEDDREEWQALQDTAGVWHPSGRHYYRHEARHSTATLLMSLGVPEAVRIAIMGHSSIASTRDYEHADVTLAREALGRVAKRLGLG